LIELAGGLTALGIHHHSMENPMKLVKMTRDDGHPADVHPDMVAEYVSGGYRVDEDQSGAASVGKVASTEPNTNHADDAMTADQALEMADGNFMAFKSAARKVLGDDIPAKKADIIDALKEKV
jgi:hypothetical protein